MTAEIKGSAINSKNILFRRFLMRRHTRAMQSRANVKVRVVPSFVVQADWEMIQNRHLQRVFMNRDMINKL